MEFDGDLTRKLIDLVSEQNHIYNPCHPNHKSKSQVDNAWRSIAGQLNVAAVDCMKKWRTLRTTYGKKHKKQKNTPSGSAVQPPEKWAYFHQLSFLDPYMKHRGTVDNFGDTSSATQSDADDDDLSTDPLDEYGQEREENLQNEPRSSRGSCRRKTPVGQQVQSQMLNFLKTSAQQMASLNETPKFDHIDQFGSFVATQLKRKPQALVDHYLKSITDILFSEVAIDVFMPATQQ